ncbi:MAG TPA: helix-turn-helix transcriptional regulator [Polyangia bacterium]|nr:helix-turn-helix transcriptional regulator [Polyangia bacterium]
MSVASLSALGARLRQLRQRRQLEARDVAKRIGKHTSAIYNIERGVHGPTVETLIAMLDLYGAELGIREQAAMMPGNNRRLCLARWFREQRHMHDLSALEVSQRLGLDVSFVYQCEKGRHVPSFDSLDRWLLILGVDLLDLIGAVE